MEQVIKLNKSIDYHVSNELILQAQNGNEDAKTEIIHKFYGYIIGKTKNHFLPNGDRGDLIQEGLIGVMNGIRNYRPEENATAGGFIKMCIDRKIVSAIKGANRLKRQILNDAHSLDLSLFNNKNGEEPLKLIDVLKADESIYNPENLFFQEYDFTILLKSLKDNLSPLEKKSLFMFAAGKTYEDISAKLNCSTKSVDNALQRVRKKSQKFLEHSWAS
ncbi:MAG: sigma-70 family RNA polymerase sigma factor [bacterium]